MRAITIVLGSLLIACVPLIRSQAHAQEEAQFVLIVNSSNPVASLSKAEVTRLFLKKTSRWDSGEKALPVDLPEDSPVRELFSREVLEKDVATVKNYWQQQIFSGRSSPPVVKSTDREVIDYVQGNAGAIGYVSASAPLEGVRELQVTQ